MHYAVLRSLAENRSEKKTFEQLRALRKRHIWPTSNEINDKKKGDSISEYEAVLWKMSEHCNFEEKANEYIRDRFCFFFVEVKDQKI